MKRNGKAPVGTKSHRSEHLNTGQHEKNFANGILIFGHDDFASGQPKKTRVSENSVPVSKLRMPVSAKKHGSATLHAGQRSSNTGQDAKNPGQNPSRTGQQYRCAGQS